MGLTTSLYTGLSGLNAAAQMISVSGNNIANVNTTAYKTGRADFQSQIVQTLKEGNGPTGELGGSNPAQIGLGVSLAGVRSNLSDGTVQPTGVNTDVALEGKGYFVLNNNGQQVYTRAGNFTFDGNSDLVTNNGARVQGYAVDENFNILQGTIGDINIPIGTQTIVQPTTEVTFKGNLNSAGDLATQGTKVTMDPLYSDAAGTTPIIATDNLDSIFNAAGTQLFTPGDVITLTGITKGTATISDVRFEVTDPATPDTTTGTDLDGHGATMQDFMDFLDNIIGIENLSGEGVTIDGTGQLTILGNAGTANGLGITSDNIIVNSGSPTPVEPFIVNTIQDANGESVRTSFVTYDSLGNQTNIDLTMVMVGKDNSGTQWRYYAQSEDGSGSDRALGTGVLTFDTNGRFVNVVGGVSTIDLSHDNTGAESPQAVTFNFGDKDLAMSALADTSSEVSAVKQDGYPIGILNDFSIDTDGTVVGVFSNGQLRNLGQLVLATFTNPGGLTDLGGNLYNVTPASGLANIVNPGQGGSGKTIGGALEGSNVDLSGEFINLISASTGFSASSRVLTTSNQLVQELLSSIR
jgi:flagellar hook protein FlgE